MRIASRLIATVLVLALASLGLWRILATGMADNLAREHPRHALDWDASNPTAMAALARQQLKHGKTTQAADSARRLLAREPLNGSGWLLLADLAQASDKAQATALATIARHRAPYALAPRAWLANEQLGQGRYPEALENLDQILRIAPARHAQLFPILIELTDDAGFVDALAQTLASRPSWRNSFIDTVLSKASSERLAIIFAALQRRGELDAPVTSRWIDRLVTDGQWGEAYARWVSGLGMRTPFRLSRVYNGRFETAPMGGGFDWRIGDSAGVLIERAALVGSDGGYALKLSFLGRRVDSIPVHQWLMLAPGSYRLRFHASAQDLNSDRGLQWMLRCLADDSELAATERLDGSFDWKSIETAFRVPEQACPAQDLWLRNAGAAAAGKLIRGTILFDDFAIERIEGEPASSLAPDMHNPEAIKTHNGSLRVPSG